MSLACALAAVAPLLAGRWEQPSGKYETLKDCRLVDDGVNDGDSFMVRRGKDTFLFRLYSVDTAETTMNYPQRVADQARHFGITPQQAVRVGLEGEKFTKRLLSAGAFTVVTCWQDAKGASAMHRYYAVVILGNGGNLAEELAAAGLARVYGFNPTTPGFSLPRLEGLERQAKARRLGAYAVAAAGSPGAAGSSAAMLAKSVFASPAPAAAAGKVDLNKASESDLVALPGIGEHFAKAIIAGRPYARPEDVLRVRGIGPKTFEKISARLTVSP